jgi:ADP-heptose:LPS heptosyltransferase
LRNKEYILVIKHGALGDFIVATSAFRAIRDYHPYAHIVLLTTKSYAGLAEQTDYFNEVWIDARPKLWHLKDLRKTLHLLRGGDNHYRFKRIYDLQGSDRTAWYFRLMGRNKPQWVGKVRGCSHPRKIPDNQMHVYDIFKTHLTRIGIPNVPHPNVDWLTDDISKFNLPNPYVLLVPGAAPTRPKKRWTAQGYADVIKHLKEQGLTCVMLGAGAEKDFSADIEVLCNEAKPINLVGQTSLGALGELGRNAQFAIGSDTGPMHIIAASGCPVLVLFSSDSDPKLHGPRSEKAEFIRVDDLKDLEPSRVINELSTLL